MAVTTDSTGISANDWHAIFPAPAASFSDDKRHVSLRRFIGVDAEIRQPKLADVILCQHLGGPKKVRRWHQGRVSDYDLDEGALTIMPANQANRWLTTGPIDFAHLTLAHALLDQIMLEEFDAAPGTWELPDLVGFRDPHIERGFRGLLDNARRPHSSRLYTESLLNVLVIELLSHRIVQPDRCAPKGSEFSKGGLPDWRLQRVVDFMLENLASDVGLADLVEVSGLSRAQFFRAFRRSTGTTPHRFLSNLRLEQARALLNDTKLSIDEVAKRVGYRRAVFSVAFRRRFGKTPSQP